LICWIRRCLGRLSKAEVPYVAGGEGQQGRQGHEGRVSVDLDGQVHPSRRRRIGQHERGDESCQVQGQFLFICFIFIGLSILFCYNKTVITHSNVLRIKGL